MSAQDMSPGIDCHIHVFGDSDRYPAIAARTYTPRAATLSEWRAVSAPLGVGRAVLVQPSAYGTDNRRMLDGLREAGDDARGIAVIDDATEDHALEEMHALGVRGIRLNLATGPVPDPAAVADQLRRAASRVVGLGWHLQVLARGRWLEEAAAIVPSLTLPIVFDHMAGADTAQDTSQAGFEAALRLLRDGLCWIKLSGADHVARRRAAPEEAVPIMRRLVETNPDRLVWGSDWPHIGKAQGPLGVEYLPIDHGHLLELLRQAAGGAYEKILSANAERLYGWT
jgi:predicted TIM-barrel fold metal-dependent hydrolase